MRDDESRVLYYPWKNGEKIFNGYYSLDEAVKYAKEINADEVEAAIWYSEDAFNDGDMADDFKTVWENKMKLGDIVIVTVDHPDGSTEQTIGDVGIITRIEHHATYGDDYTVHTPYSDYAYGGNQIRELRDDECRDALYNLLNR